VTLRGELDQFEGDLLDEDATNWIRHEHPWIFAATSTESSRHLKQEFDELVAVIPHRTTEGRNARQAISYLLFSAPRRDNQDEKSWLQTLAARAIADLCESDKLAQEEFVQVVTHALSNPHDLNPNARKELLRAALAMNQMNESGLVSQNYFQIAELLLRTLETEINRPVEQRNHDFILQVMELQKRFRHPLMFAVLEAIQKSHEDQRVQEAAGQMLTELKESALALWDSTAPDQLSELDHRARRLRDALNESKDPKQRAQAVYNGTKGSVIASEADPRVRYLNFALNDNDDLVRLAAAHVLVLDCFEQQHWAEAVNIVAELAVNCTRLGISRDALQILNELEQSHPDRAEVIAQAKEAASRSFIARLSD